MSRKCHHSKRKNKRRVNIEIQVCEHLKTNTLWRSEHEWCMDCGALRYFGSREWQLPTYLTQDRLTIALNPRRHENAREVAPI